MLLDAVSLSILFILVAVGLTIVYGFMEVLNAAHAGFWLLGGYLTLTTSEVFGSFWAGALAILIVVGLLGFLMEYLLLRPTYEAGTIPQFLLTFGVFFIISSGILILWGGQPRTINPPDLFAESMSFLGITYPTYRLFTIAIGAVLIVVTWMLLERTNTGLIVRASLLDKEMARGLGHNIPRIYTIVFVLSVLSAALAGMLMAPIRGVATGWGLTVLLEAFAIVLIGGLGSFRGTVLAGFIVGISYTFVTRFIAFGLGEAIIFFVLLVVLLVRPVGIFGIKEAAKH